MDFDPTSRNYDKDDSMNIFSKRINSNNNIKNHIPISIRMLRNINPQTKKLDDIIQVYKVILISRVTNTNAKLGNKMQLSIIDQQTQEEGRIIHQVHSVVQHMQQFKDNMFYKFICMIKIDHGQPILHCVKFTEVKDSNEIKYHNLHIKLSQLDRQRIKIIQQKKQKQIGL